MSNSSIKIIAAEPDMYVAEVGESVILKLGPRCGQRRWGVEFVVTQHSAQLLFHNRLVTC